MTTAFDDPSDASATGVAPLSGLELAVAQVLQECLDAGHSPSCREIADELGMKSKGRVNEMIAKLVKRGIARNLRPGGARAIELLVRVPEVEECEVELTHSGSLAAVDARLLG
jgi:SOS-response transcriptional repressor LexA